MSEITTREKMMLAALNNLAFSMRHGDDTRDMVAYSNVGSIFDMSPEYYDIKEGEPLYDLWWQLKECIESFDESTFEPDDEASEALEMGDIIEDFREAQGWPDMFFIERVAYLDHGYDPNPEYKDFIEKYGLTVREDGKLSADDED